MIHELRDALRTLRRTPVFSVVAVSTLALAIGSTTSVFSVVDAVLVRGLPYASPGRLQTIYERNESGALRTPSFPTFHDWQTATAEVSDAIEGFAFVRGDGVSIPGSDGPERQIAAYVSPGFFELLGSSPAIGRTFLPEEERPGAANVAVISHEFFMRHYGGDPSVLGKTIPIDSVPTTIIGVMPRGFAYPNFGSGGWLAATVWQPIAVFQATHQALSLRGLHADSRTILRVRDGVDAGRAVTAMRTIATRLANAYPVEQGHWTNVEMRPLSQEMFGPLPSNLALIAGAVGLVLLLACANVANLLLVRSSVRSRELAVRLALGANRWRIARHLLTEAAVIAGIAGAVGVGLAFAIVRFVRQYAGQRLPFTSYMTVDARALAVAVGVSAVTALLIGVLPVLHAGRGDLIARLRGGATNDAGGKAQRRARDTLVAVQFALAITVLVGAGLLVQSIRRVAAVALGYDATGLVWFSVSPSRGKYGEPAQAAALYQRIMSASKAVPSVEEVAAAGGALLPTKVETNEQRGSDARIEARYHPISAEYLRLMRLRIVEGRAFTDDDMRSPSGFLVTENLAKQLWPNRSALGQQITVRRSSQARVDFGHPITLPVVGVVADYREFGPEQPAPQQVFLPYTLEVWPWMNFVVRSPRPAAILNAVTDAVRGVEPAIEFVGKPAASGNRYGGFGDPRVFMTTVLSGFAAVSLLLAAIGLYGIVAYGVAQRTRELGIRIAVGATRNAILKLILGHAARLVVTGVAVGLLAAAAATKVLRAMLFETSTTDAMTFVVVTVVLSMVATIASLAPALRATRTDPLLVIRAE
jgi:putative ABC transport system permease protein